MPEDLSRAPYRDAKIDIEKRLDDLVGRMTTREKINQIGCVWSTHLVTDGEFCEKRADLLLAEGIGQVTRIGATTGLRPRESAAFMNRVQRYLSDQTRLGIPALVHEESTAGFTARDAGKSHWSPLIGIGELIVIHSKLMQ